MNNIDYLNLDGRSLYMLKLIHELRSVTAAATRLGVTQSSVSHSLDRMRGLLGDPLFIKTGRSMVPTARVEAMMDDIGDVLDGLQSLYSQAAFEPGRARERFSVTCNDFEHDLMVPAIFSRLQSEAPHCSLRTYQHHFFSYDCLEKGHTDLQLSPYPPKDTADLVITPLCTDRMITYYDPHMRDAPKSIEDFATSRHAILSLGQDEGTHVDKALSEQKLERQVAYFGPNFASIAMVVRGSNMLATAPSRMANSIFKDLAWAETPLALDPIDFYMIWHIRNRHSPRHKWFRDLVRDVSKSLPQAETIHQANVGRGEGGTDGMTRSSKVGRSASDANT